MTNRRAAWLTAGFVAYLAALSLWSIAQPDRKLSEFENRALQQFPSFSAAKLWDGRYTEQLGNYFADQFAARDAWVGIKSDLERMSGKTENRQVFFGKDNYLFERFQTPGAQYEANLNEIRRFAARHAVTPMHMLLVPYSQAVYADKLPAYAEATSYDTAEFIRGTYDTLGSAVTSVSVLDALKRHKSDSVFFRTDHHWTMRGAYYGYAEFARAAGFEPIPLESVPSRVISSSFYGTYYTKANNRHLLPDKLELLEQSLPPYKVCYSDASACSDSFYHMEALSVRDQYKVFFNGNRAWTTIETGAGTGRSIVIFKDSYANAFVPLLAPHYSSIHMIDLRFFHESVDDYLTRHNFDHILFLYGVKTVAEDDIFKWLN
ncbi:DHHW family protein [Paenibacillus thiaminolyticus]|uniref:DHHW family protein n=1 Tax=Paenibacillus thiaminolyticus TaxID=49283 RepID=A0AAP9DTZ5_PANTH|nr:DHHW family protein [Paenibacillus thiaminolyticus]MCY9537445.1 DHHW family protein [Paenibacillus thiaminolyticus]MCY9601132.1 DHHW family protein [Paenibacillus thiaminolyticus]MCY9607454.1 DHHW family protein [Paenibacillus thiaminolyticus]MCY9613149.1 DHHW family protein [Paenibacillus thiaminolyticus]MCY9617564.1 DHHW family protein [Paenibacillus thiaminolyticus]